MRVKENVFAEDEYKGVMKLENNIKYNLHRKRKNNIVVAAMYVMYQQGKSLEEIARSYRKSRQAVYDLFHSRGYKLRSKKLDGLVTINGINFTLTKGGYLRGSLAGKRVLAHHLIWEHYHGKIPEGYVIYFINGNKQCIGIDNLKLIKKSDMSKTFNPKGNNQYTK
jgi:hypothetical protein